MGEHRPSLSREEAGDWPREGRLHPRQPVLHVPTPEPRSSGPEAGEASRRSRAPFIHSLVPTTRHRRHAQQSVANGNLSEPLTPFEGPDRSVLCLMGGWLPQPALPTPAVTCSARRGPARETRAPRAWAIRPPFSPPFPVSLGGPNPGPGSQAVIRGSCGFTLSSLAPSAVYHSPSVAISNPASLVFISGGLFLGAPEWPSEATAVCLQLQDVLYLSDPEDGTC